MIKQNFFPSKHLQNALNQQINTIFTLQVEFFIELEYVSLKIVMDHMSSVSSAVDQMTNK